MRAESGFATSNAHVEEDAVLVAHELFKLRQSMKRRKRRLRRRSLRCSDNSDVCEITYLSEENPNPNKNMSGVVDADIEQIVEDGFAPEL